MAKLFENASLNRRVGITKGGKNKIGLTASHTQLADCLKKSLISKNGQLTTGRSPKEFINLKMDITTKCKATQLSNSSNRRLGCSLTSGATDGIATDQGSRNDAQVVQHSEMQGHTYNPIVNRKAGLTEGGKMKNTD